jgi:hypothetical protein
VRTEASRTTERVTVGMPARSISRAISPTDRWQVVHPGAATT